MSSCQDSTKYWKCGVETLEARVIGLEKLGKHDVELVGGKNSSLGEMISHLSNVGVSVPGGFATTVALIVNSSIKVDSTLKFKQNLPS